MAQLAINLPLALMQTRWASQLNPIIANPLINGQQIDNIILTANTPLKINHNLQQLPNGWLIVDKTSFADVKRTQPFSTSTITLESSANTQISIWIY